MYTYMSTLLIIEFLLHRLAHLFGVSEDTFLRHTETILEILHDNLHKIIRFPNPDELPEIVRRFNHVGK